MRGNENSNGGLSRSAVITRSSKDKSTPKNPHIGSADFGGVLKVQSPCEGRTARFLRCEACMNSGDSGLGGRTRLPVLPLLFLPTILRRPHRKFLPALGDAAPTEILMSAVHGASAALASAEVVGVSTFDFLAAFLAVNFIDQDGHRDTAFENKFVPIC